MAQAGEALVSTSQATPPAATSGQELLGATGSPRTQPHLLSLIAPPPPIRDERLSIPVFQLWDIKGKRGLGASPPIWGKDRWHFQPCTRQQNVALFLSLLGDLV